MVIVGVARPPSDWCGASSVEVGPAEHTGDSTSFLLSFPLAVTEKECLSLSGRLRDSCDSTAKAL